MLFSRTTEGLAAEYLFYEEVLVYVEGRTDIPFYEEILKNYNCRIKASNGKRECEKLATFLEQNNYPYVVVLDGDYEILERTRSRHRRVVLLHRYSFENYLFEEKLIEQFCRDRQASENRLEKLADTFRIVLEETRLKFEELIILDATHQRIKTGFDVLPEKPDRFFTQKGLGFRESQIEPYVEQAKTVNEQDIDDTTTLFTQFLRQRRFIDLLPGHFAFGIIRRLIIHTVGKKGKDMSNDDIRIYLSRFVWQLAKTRDHNSLKRRLHRAVREAEQIRQALQNASP